MRIDSLLNRRGIVRRTISLHPQRVHIHPLFTSRQRRNRSFPRRRNTTERRRVITHIDLAHRTFIRHDQSIVKRTDFVEIAFPRNLLSALAQQRKHRHILEHSVLKTNLSERTFLIADDHRRARNILKPAILPPKLIRIFGIDINRHRHIAKRIANQRQPRLMLANRCLALPFKDRINQRELPRRRSLLG